MDDDYLRDFSKDYLGWRLTYYPHRERGNCFIEIAPGPISYESFHDTFSFNSTPVDNILKMRSCVCSPKTGGWKGVAVVIHRSIKGGFVLPGDLFISDELGVFTTADFRSITDRENNG